MDKQEEIWRPVKGYEGFYEVSNRGRVRSVGRWVTDKNGIKVFREGRILKPGRNRKGYLYVCLHRDGKQRNFYIHRLVAEVFIPNPENKPEVNHIDETKNNVASNLEWCDRKYNVNYGTGIKRGHVSQMKPVQALDPKTGVVIKEFPSTAEAGRKGFDHSAVSACCLGKKRTYKGFVWRYKDDYDQESAWTPVKIGAASLSKAVLAIDPETGIVVREFPSMMEAGRNGFTQSRVSACCRGEQGTHKGYRWRFKPVSN